METERYYLEKIRKHNCQNLHSATITSAVAIFHKKLNHVVGYHNEQGNTMMKS